MVTAEEPLVRADYAALTEPLPPEEVREFRLRSKAEGAPWATAPNPLGEDRSLFASVGRAVPVLVPLVGVLFFAVILGPQLPTVIGALLQLTVEAPFPYNLVLVAFLALAVLLAGAGIAALIQWLVRGGFPRGWWEAALRLTRFAAANGLVYGHEVPVDYAGSVFQVGESRVAERRLSSASGRRTEIGTLRYVVVTRSENRTTRTAHWWGYLAIGLDRNLPHMLLDARANDRSLFGIRTSNLPVSFDRSQVLSLEGDFDSHFTLYAPREYETDALYVFTPDLMALLVDETGDLDVEIVDDTMYVYSTTPFDLLSPATYERMRRIVSTVGAKTLRQTARYADERGGDRAQNLVAAPGRRLKRRRNWIGGVVIVAVVAFWIWETFLAPVFGFGS